MLEHGMMRTIEGAQGANAGYTLGGSSTTGAAGSTSIAQKRTFSTDVVTSIASILSVARWLASGFSSTTRGYCSGGYNTSSIVQNKIDGIIFASDTSFVSSAVLSTSRGYTGSTMSLDKGYAFGGYPSNTSMGGVVFATDTANNPAASCSSGIELPTRNGVQTSLKGYIAGSINNPNYNIDVLTFTTETKATASFTLTSLDGGRHSIAGASSASKGYFMGGSITNALDGITFSTETGFNIAATLPRQITPSAGLSSASNGYSTGGQSGVSTTTDGISFSTDTTFQSSNLVTAVIYTTGVQG